MPPFFLAQQFLPNTPLPCNNTLRYVFLVCFVYRRKAVEPFLRCSHEYTQHEDGQGVQVWILVAPPLPGTMGKGRERHEGRERAGGEEAILAYFSRRKYQPVCVTQIGAYFPEQFGMWNIAVLVVRMIWVVVARSYEKDSWRPSKGVRSSATVATVKQIHLKVNGKRFHHRVCIPLSEIQMCRFTLTRIQAILSTATVRKGHESSLSIACTWAAM